MTKKTPLLNRRAFTTSALTIGATGLIAPKAFAQVRSAVTGQTTADLENRPMADGGTSGHNISNFRSRNWRDHYDSLGVGVIVEDTQARALHFWSGDGQTYRVYPTSVPMTEDLTKRGRTEIVRKKVGPDWAPTPSMIKRDPSLPRYVGPGDPLNPLGTHAMYLSWTYYLIHGTQDTRKIGRRASSGCFGLYNEHIQELFGMAQVGTKVHVI
ncbi:L,D-transpeptidase [Paracoccaceae bacterium GXU_MW_L88]